MVIMEDRSGKLTMVDNEDEKVIRPEGVVPYDALCERRKRVEYILSPKNQADHGVIPFLLKIKDEDYYVVFKTPNTLKLSDEEVYIHCDKITNRNIIRYIVRDHNISLDNALLGICNIEDYKKITEYNNLTD